MRAIFKTLFLFIFIIISVSNIFSQTGNWTNLNPQNPPSPRNSFGIAYLRDNIIMIFGGILDNGDDTDETWIYDYTMNSWTQIITDVHPPAVDLPAMAHIADGKAFLFGGEYFYSDVTWIFDYETLTWTALNPSRHPYGRDRACCSYLGDNKVIIFSGFPGPPESEDYALDTWIYDLSKNEWDSLKTPSPPDREQGMMCELNDKQILLYGGWPGIISDLDDNFIFEIESKHWHDQVPVQNNIKRSISSMAQLKINKILLFGGDTRDAVPYSPDQQWSDDTWFFNMDDISWTKLNPITKPTGRYYHKLVHLTDNKVLMFGGQSKTANLNDTWLFEYYNTEVAENIPSDNDNIRITNRFNNLFNINIKLIKPEKIDIELYNINGMLINDLWQGQSQDNEFNIDVNVDNYNTGIYFLKINISNDIYFRKIAIIH